MQSDDNNYVIMQQDDKIKCLQQCYHPVQGYHKWNHQVI
jgi:hypothetical protein